MISLSKIMSISRKIRVAVVIPTYDEKENIVGIVTEILLQQKHLSLFEIHVVIADSSSKDGTEELARKLTEKYEKVNLISIPERGIGLGLYHGIRYGIEEIKGEVIIEMDADFQHNPEDIPKFLKKIEQGYNLVIGSRFIQGSINKMPLYRKILSICANQLIRTVLGLRKVTEMTTSYRAFKKELFLNIKKGSVPWHEKSFIAVPIFLIRMIENGAKVTEVPITMDTRAKGYSKMFYFQYLRDIIVFSLKSKLNL